jgi:hypothetical protein
MITIIDCAERKNQQGETFVALILSGGVEFVKSKQGKFYATSRKASIPSTLDLKLAKLMIGQQMPGTIVRKPVEPYLFTTATGEQVELDFTYEYSEQASNFTETVFNS